MSDIYITLNGLKQWPKLFALACKYTEIDGDFSLDEALKQDDMGNLFYPHKTEEGPNFWVAIMNGNFDQARTLRPDLFEEEPCEFVVGRKYRLIKDDSDGFCPNLVGQELVLTSLTSVGGTFEKQGGGSVDFWIKTHNPNKAEPAILEPIPDEQQAQCHMDEVTNIPAADNPGKLSVPEEQEENDKALEDAALYGIGATLNGKRIAPKDFLRQPSREEVEEICSVQEQPQEAPKPWTGLPNDAQREANLAVSDRIFWRRKVEP